MNFIHLHVHSEYSQLDGLGKPEQYAQRAKDLEMLAIAVTDHGNIDGAIKWQRACKKIGVKSIIGAELYIVPDMKIKEKGEHRGHITFLVKNQQGWKALLKMITISNLEGFYNRPRIDYQTLLNNVNDGLVMMSGCSNSFLLLPGGVSFFHDLTDLGGNGGDFYLEVMPHCIDLQVKINRLCLNLAGETGIPLVATNDCHYVLKDQWKAQEVLLAIQRKAVWGDPKRWKFSFTGLHLRTAFEMMEEFEKQGVLSKRQYTLAMMNTQKIAEQCWNFEIQKQSPELPLSRYEKETGRQADELLQEFCVGHHDVESWDFQSEEYKIRYQNEIEMINKKDFARYFLIIFELVQWCKQKEIMIGPGRGSVGGSLVAFLLGITQVDPLKYGLLFERFISEDRIDYPDIDIDFDRNRVDEVIAHLREEYGEYNVVGISTFMTMRSKAAIRDVGRVFELPAKEVDVFAKSIKIIEGEKDIVASAGESTSEGQEFKARFSEQFELICDLEGQVRGGGQHPAGLILSGQDLRESDRGNLCVRSGTKVINWNMEDCDYVGLMKIDVLKLGALSVLNEAKRLIGKDFKFEDLTFDDSIVFDLLSEGKTAGIFQVTGYACTKLIIEMKVDNFNDIVATIALARPGPLSSGMTEQYVRRKHGEKWIPLHPVYEAITKDTYGVIAYQEQVMKVMTDIAGFSGSDADQIRKVIGKKRDVKEFEPYREAFLEGCREKETLNEVQANEFWQGLLKHASYSFNKSHAVEYAMIGYWTAWLKVHYLSEFICASLTFGDETDKEGLIKEAQEKGMQIVTPKVGVSDAQKWIVKDGKLYMPFIEIKGIGEKEAEKCGKMRIQGGRRKGFFDLSYYQTPETVGGLKGNSTKILLQSVRAFDLDPASRPENCKTYFQFNIEERNKKW